MIEKKSENKKEIKLPPLPDDAVAFGKISLESMVDGAIEESTDANVAELATAEDQVVLDAAKKEADSALAEFIEDKQTPVITTDPEPTPVDPEDIFDPEPQNALEDFDEEGGLAPVKIPGPTLSRAKAISTGNIRVNEKEENFSPGTIQDALINKDTEGGIVTNKSTGSMKTSGDASEEGRQTSGKSQEDDESNYRVYGFTVQYNTQKPSGEITTVTSQVSDYFKDKTEAMITVNGSKYLMPNTDKSFSVVDIVSGVPQISLGDRHVLTYTGGKIGMGGYWKQA